MRSPGTPAAGTPVAGTPVAGTPAAGTQGYGENLICLSQRYDAVDVQALYAPAWPYFPAAPAPVLDIGAGSGRDAAYFAERGHPVTAVEPFGPFRRTAALNHPHPAIE
ncbi:MAG: SAM-dependent methyltransferase [Cognaticolwellia sp.]